MSARYVSVGWSRTKLVYDVILIFSICIFLEGFFILARSVGNLSTPTDEASLRIRVFANCAFLLLTIALSIGPLARLDKRFLPLLYNRRHLGVITFAVVMAHAYSVFDWYLSYSPINPWKALFLSDGMFYRFDNFPYVPFGVLAFIILAMLATTSHDFWLNFLGPGIWKQLHMGIYITYGCVVAHVSFGALQDVQKNGLPILVAGSAFFLLCLHGAAAFQQYRLLNNNKSLNLDANWVRVAEQSEMKQGQAEIIRVPGREFIAVFRDNDQFFAISHRCAHQNGPLGEGRVINGHIVCPWHGHEFNLTNGCAPSPFTDRVPTYSVKVEAGIVYVNPTPILKSRENVTEDKS